MLDEEGGKILFNQLMEIWFLPEIKKRREEGKIKGKFVLNSAQVILNPKISKNEIRLNREIKALVIGVARRKIEVNEIAPLGDMIKEIREVRLTDHDDPDVGHVTMFIFKGNWIIHFDFRYYKIKIKEIFDAALEFFEMAKISFSQKKNRPFVDNLFSAVELLSTCQIYNMAGKNFHEKRKHKEIQRKYNAFVKIGNFKPEYKDALNNLSELRLAARYVKKKFELDQVKADNLMKIVNDMLEFTKKRIG